MVTMIWNGGETQLIDIQRTLFLIVSKCALFEGAAAHTCTYAKVIGK